MGRSDDVFTLDEARWPLVHATYLSTPTMPEFEQSLVLLDASLDKPGRRAMVVQAIEGTTLNAAMRQKQADWVGRQRRALSEKCAGMAFVLPSRVMRGVVTAVFWIQPLPAEHAIFATRPEAEAWCRDRLRGHHAPSP